MLPRTMDSVFTATNLSMYKIMHTIFGSLILTRREKKNTEGKMQYGEMGI